MDWEQPIIVSHKSLLDQLTKKDKEQSTLLETSRRIACAQKREELWDIISDGLLSLFGARYYTLCLINEDGKTHSPFLHSADENIKRRDTESPIIHKAHAIEDGIFDKALAAEAPLIFDIKQLIKNRDTPHYIVHWHNAGIREMMVTKILNANEPRGLLYLYADQYGAFNEEQFSLLNGFADLLGMCISNVLASEEIKKYKVNGKPAVAAPATVREEAGPSQLIGTSAEIQKVFRLISQVAEADSTVLVTGETGTGKELVASAIHHASLRNKQHMVKINCAAIPATLIESELFGHEKGSFTGAMDRRIGKFELANNSTIFLDEIGELSLELQSKLLRVLQEKEIERIGGKGSIKVNVRIIAATNRNLEREVQAGRFRSDLFYRLNVFPISLPPLRERQEDIPALAHYFMERFNRQTGKKVSSITQRAMKSLLAYHWPGNIRELEHLIERAVLMTNNSSISQVALPQRHQAITVKKEEAEDIIPLAAMEREYILKVLKACKGKVSGPNGAAEKLGLPPTTLISKMQKLNIKKELLLLK